MVLLRCGDNSVDCGGVVFDKDGTLIDSLKIWPELIRTRVAILQKRLNLGQEVARMAERVMGLDDQGEIILGSAIVIGTREQTASAVNAVLYLKTGLAWDKGMEEILKAFAESDLELGLAAQAIPVQGAAETLCFLHRKGLKIAVATNDSLSRTKSLMDLAGLGAYISAYACRDEVQEGKPAPDLFNLACKRLNLRPKDCLIVGDSVLDLKMADFAGGAKLKVGVLTGASAAADFTEYADVIFSSISKLIKDN
ncbi:MAG TPA: HAD family hydrolase [Desulfitobacteriaceae bacterium]|nr:HAD family hydrolase [Desulfitobacteriaceae bacterium]